MMPYTAVDALGRHHHSRSPKRAWLAATLGELEPLALWRGTVLLCPEPGPKQKRIPILVWNGPPLGAQTAARGWKAEGGKKQRRAEAAARKSKPLKQTGLVVPAAKKGKK